MNVSDLRKMLGLPDIPIEADSLSDVRSTADSDDAVSQTRSSNSSSRHFRVRRQSMEQLDLIKVFLLFFIRFLFCRPSPKSFHFFFLCASFWLSSFPKRNFLFTHLLADTRWKTSQFPTESGNFTPEYSNVCQSERGRLL